MLSKETKVGVKNKENKTACFIEMEGLLNSPKLISDLPGLGIEEQQGEGRELGGGWESHPKAGRRCRCSPLGWLQGLWKPGGLQSGRWQLMLCPTGKSR